MLSKEHQENVNNIWGLATTNFPDSELRPMWALAFSSCVAKGDRARGKLADGSVVESTIFAIRLRSFSLN